MPSNHPRLLADIGGTNARFAWQAAPGAPLVHGATLPCAAHESLEAAVRHYLQTQGLPVPAGCAIGIANPVTGDPVQMTNHHWSFSASALRRGLGLERLAVVNDFTALALALPLLTRDDLHLVGGGEAVAGAPMALIGPGTGLGVSGLLPAGMGAGAAASEEGAPEAGRAGGALLEPAQPAAEVISLRLQRALRLPPLAALRRRLRGGRLLPVERGAELLAQAGHSVKERADAFGEGLILVAHHLIGMLEIADDVCGSLELGPRGLGAAVETGVVGHDLVLELDHVAVLQPAVGELRRKLFDEGVAGGQL